MTLTPGVERPRSTDSRYRRHDDDLRKPQGLQTTSPVPNPHYPHLGFNPVPGDTETVRGLHKKLNDCAKTLEGAHDLVTKLLDGSYWKGDAAVAFREQLDGGPLPLNLKNAAHSIRKAAKQLVSWEGELDDYQRRARKLEEDAKDARAAVDRAEGRAAEAADDPHLRGKGADSDAAQKTLTHANSDVKEAQAELDKVIGRAKKLAEEHESTAKRRAGKIRDATKKLVPHEPGWFDEALDWLSDNLPDILSFVAGAIAVAVLLLSGPLGWTMATIAMLMLTSSAVSLAAFALRGSDPEVRASLWDGVTKGELDADFWSNTVSVGADLAGALPGLGAVVKGGAEATQAIRSGAQSLGFWEKAATYGSKTVEQTRIISELGNPLIARAVRGCSDPEKAARVIEGASGLTGVGTGGFGLHNKLVDADASDIKDGSVAGIDGTRLVLDNAGIFKLATHVF
ncbi:putative T7SS-secreted protein [Streptomyces justiciae]|uniref:putative T7SS-secreted protein n=1 Tax=Streptomyces justiciae TaxID=2780140 RepID=UPI00187F4899|nr:WXG100 family type VII secretion target [Streptomyces justiciae]MBE8474112.1 WXG100 family type VII secretion target [Streptomyces justiciae]